MMRLFLGIGSVANTPQPWIGDRLLSIIDHRIARVGAPAFALRATAAKRGPGPGPALPVPNAAGIDVNEVGRRVEPHAAKFQRRGGGSKVIEPDTREANVDGLANHVQAAAGNAGVGAAALAQHGVGLRGP